MCRRQLASLAISLLLALPGCQAIGVLADKIGGQPDVQPDYTPDKLKPLLVIAENFRNPGLDRGDTDQLAQFVTDELDREKVAPMVDPQKLAQIRDAHPNDFGSMSVIAVAREAGARQVIYIDAPSLGVGVQPGSDLMKGVASARVSVIDVDAGRTVFPGESGGVPIAFSSTMRNAGDHVTADSVRTETIVGLGIKIGRMFHKWKPGDATSVDESDI